MFLILPLSIFIVSVAIIIWVITRKFVYLKKLVPETLVTTGGQENFWIEMFPEIAGLLRKINLRAFGINFLTEFEKLLRKLRLISMKIDGLTNRLIHRVRKETKEQSEILKEAKLEEEKKTNGADAGDIMEKLGDNSEDLKQKEQLLIIEIAKNPKDVNLYRELGTIYMRIGDFDDAKQSFNKALELEPGNEATERKLRRVLAKIEEIGKLQL